MRLPSIAPIYYAAYARPMMPLPGYYPGMPYAYQKSEEELKQEVPNYYFYNFNSTPSYSSGGYSGGYNSYSGWNNNATSANSNYWRSNYMNPPKPQSTVSPYTQNRIANHHTGFDWTKLQEHWQEQIQQQKKLQETKLAEKRLQQKMAAEKAKLNKPASLTKTTVPTVKPVKSITGSASSRGGFGTPAGGSAHLSAAA